MNEDIEDLELASMSAIPQPSTRNLSRYHVIFADEDNFSAWIQRHDPAEEVERLYDNE